VSENDVNKLLDPPTLDVGGEENQDNMLFVHGDGAAQDQAEDEEEFVFELEIPEEGMGLC
jgi:hypothetical protein